MTAARDKAGTELTGAGDVEISDDMTVPFSFVEAGGCYRRIQCDADMSNFKREVNRDDPLISAASEKT